MRFPYTFLVFSTFLTIAIPALAATGDTPGNAAAEQAAALAAQCAKLACRKGDQTVEMRMDAQRGIRFKAQPLPYIDSNGAVILYPGEAITISLAEENGKLAVPRLVSVTMPTGPVDLGALADPAATNTVTFALTQDIGKPDMQLVATNRTKLLLKYSATMGLPSESGMKPARTSICPLFPATLPEGFAGHETWPHPIGILILSNLHIIPQGGPMNCD